MTSLPSNFPRRVRIRGGEFGASARAMHREAALENVSRATIERKTMSTKTTFKRVALVAVAALGIGMVSAVPSNAAPAFADLHVYSAGTQIIGGQATVTLDVDTSTVTNVVTTGVGSIVSAAAGTQPSGYTNPTVGTASSSFTITGAGNRGIANLVYTSAVVGTTTITATPLDSNGVPGTAVTKTITWISGATDASVNHSTAFIGTTGAEAVADATLTPAATASTTSIGRVDVRQYASSDSTTQTATASSQAVTVSIAGAGSVGSTISGAATGPSITISAGTAQLNTVYVYANGVAGTGTVTITVGGVAVATKTVTFIGTLASFTATPTKTVLGAGSTDPVAIKGFDTNGNAAGVGTFYLTSSNTAVATVPTSVAGGTGTNVAGTVTGIAVGTATITVANASSSPTITKTFTITVGKAAVTTLSISTDKTSYSAGEKVVLTVTGLGSDGKSVGDATIANAFGTGGVTSNVAVQGTLPGVSVTFAGGVATYTIYAPLQDGTVNLTATEGASTTNVSGGGTAATITTSFDVANPASGAAVDAANAATDAANYAADAADAATTAAQEATAAAQAAQDSADAATAAVVALGLRVDTLMASVRAQLTSLSNLLVRIIKKTKA